MKLHIIPASNSPEIIYEITAFRVCCKSPISSQPDMLILWQGDLKQAIMLSDISVFWME